ncbi:MAG: biotin--[acetyl-CoA-carboxylase] ligase, partial [Promethearchaeota archaeon]
MNFKLKRKIIEFDEVGSTQEIAREYLEREDCVHGLVIIANTQSRGIGRHNRVWHSPRGGLWLSIIFKKQLPFTYLEGFSVRAGLKIVEKLEETVPLSFEIRWPNDLMLSGKKVGGILVDSSSVGEYLDHLILGIGINVNNELIDLPEEIRENSTSIKNELGGKEFSLEKIRDAVLDAQDQIMLEFKEGEISDLSKDWNNRSFTINSLLSINLGEKIIEGIEQGITPTGALIIKTLNGNEKIISSGEVRLVKQL